MYIDIDISFTCIGLNIYAASFELIDIDNMTHNIVIYRCLKFINLYPANVENMVSS